MIRLPDSIASRLARGFAIGMASVLAIGQTVQKDHIEALLKSEQGVA